MASTSGDKRAEIYTYEAQDPVYAMNWSVSLRPTAAAKSAVY
jgi:hypothetical protein